LASKARLLEIKAQLERDKDALMASQVIADYNAICGSLQTVAMLLEEEDAKEAK
jgi:hypothetical protein